MTSAVCWLIGVIIVSLLLFILVWNNKLGRFSMYQGDMSINLQGNDHSYTAAEMKTLMDETRKIEHEIFEECLMCIILRPFRRCIAVDYRYTVLYRDAQYNQGNDTWNLAKLRGFVDAGILCQTGVNDGQNIVRAKIVSLGTKFVKTVADGIETNNLSHLPSLEDLTPIERVYLEETALEQGSP